MEHGTALCNIKAFTKKDKIEYMKFPTLCELYTHLFYEEPINLHNSFNDVIVCLRCFYKMYFREDICHNNLEICELIN